MRRRYSIVHIFKLCLFYGVVGFMAIATSLMQRDSLYRYEASFGEVQEAERVASSIDASMPLSAGDFSLADASPAEQGSLLNQQPDLPAAEPPVKIIEQPQPKIPSPQLKASNIIEVKVARGDTLASILRKSGVDSGDVHAILDSIKPVYSPKKLAIGQRISFVKGDCGENCTTVKRLSWEIDSLQSIEVSGLNKRFAARIQQAPLDKKAVRRSGTIHSSLTAATAVAGVPSHIISTLTKSFSYDVDFQRDIRTADQYDIVFEQFYTKEGKFVRNGELVYASLTLGDKKHAIFRHTHRDGSSTYYTRDGLGIRKPLLRTPVNVSKIGDGFGPRRHPILGYTRMHRGVDFPAPTGTPIYAAGNGVIDEIGYSAGYGNMIKIRHNEKFATLYGHLSGYAKGLRRGDRVKQSEIVGYVGSSGLATGPHLHYEIHIYDRPVNPLKIRQDVSTKLAGEELRRFQNNRLQLEKFLSQSPKDTSVAFNDAIGWR